MGCKSLSGDCIMCIALHKGLQINHSVKPQIYDDWFFLTVFSDLGEGSFGRSKSLKKEYTWYDTCASSVSAFLAEQIWESQ